MSIKICSIGDIMLGENIHHYHRGIPTCYRGNFGELITRPVAEIMNHGDIVIGNLECSLMSDQEHRKAPLKRAMYSAPESVLDCFKKLKTPIILNLANNHFGQHGQAAADYTMNCLDKRGINYIGMKRTSMIFVINGWKICIWGATLVKEDFSVNYIKSSAETLIKDLKWKDKANNEIWIISLHWGTEYRTQPERSQQKLAQKLTSFGVNLVLGHHPHVIQPVETMREGRIFYSHGNFIFDQNFSKITKIGLISLTDVEHNISDYYLTQSHKYKVELCSKVSAQDLRDFCYKWSSPFLPLAMRFLMKLELCIKLNKVPRQVWLHILYQLSRKTKLQINKISRN